MKIAIISLPFGNNVGEFLQAFALQYVLQDLGHTVYVADFERVYEINLLQYPIFIVKRLIMKLLRKKTLPIFFELNKNKKLNDLTKRRFEATHFFFPNRFLVKSFSNKKDFKNFDAFIVGSDQVWRKGYFTFQYRASITNAFLAFAKDWDVKRVAYAASFGDSEWGYNKNETLICGELLKKFDGVSVREDSGVYLCQQNLGVNAVHVLDPTFLLPANIYSSVFIHQQANPSSTLFKYILTESDGKNTIVNYIHTIMKLEPYAVVSRYDDENAPESERLMPPISQWLQGILNAKFVVTDSFHGTVFSIIFNKPFVTIMNKERGEARFNSLLKMFGLENRLVSDNADKQKLNSILEQKIDFSIVNAILEEKKRHSIEFLKNSLK